MKKMITILGLMILTSTASAFDKAAYQIAIETENASAISRKKIAVPAATKEMKKQHLLDITNYIESVRIGQANEIEKFSATTAELLSLSMDISLSTDLRYIAKELHSELAIAWLNSIK